MWGVSMRKALRHKSANPSNFPGLQDTRSPFDFVRDWMSGDRPPLRRHGGGAASPRLGLKLEPLERRLLLSAELSSTSLVTEPLFETEGSYPPAIIASFSQQPSQVLSSDSDAVEVELPAVSQ